MKVLKIYDPAMSGSARFNESDAAAERAQLDQFIENLDKCSVRVERFTYTPESSDFSEEPVAGALKEKGSGALPLVMIDDEIISAGEYPDLGKLSGLLSAAKLPFEMPDCSACRGCD